MFRVHYAALVCVFGLCVLKQTGAIFASVSIFHNSLIHHNPKEWCWKVSHILNDFLPLYNGYIHVFEGIHQQDQ